MTYFYPSTPPASRVREGEFSEAILPVGVQPGPVYVYDAATRIWHWTTMLCIIALCVTGYFIGSPLPSIGGEAYDHFMFGYIRLVHFIAGMILGVAFLLRLYRVFVGGPHARQIFYIPFWNLHWWKEVFGEIRWYLFIGKPKEYVGHNPLAHLAMFLMFLLPTLVLLLTGFALYAEDALASRAPGTPSSDGCLRCSATRSRCTPGITWPCGSSSCSRSSTCTWRSART